MADDTFAGPWCTCGNTPTRARSLVINKLIDIKLKSLFERRAELDRADLADAPVLRRPGANRARFVLHESRVMRTHNFAGDRRRRSLK
jgi:putative transcriptional regulator